MSPDFGHRGLSEEHIAYLAALEKYMAEDASSERDFRPVLKAAAFFCKAGKATRSDIGPVLGVFYHGFFDYDGRWYWLARAFVAVYVAWKRLRYWRAPMWNDFEMTRWALSRDPYYIESLYKHLKRGSLAQKGTGEWMVRSVCQQDGEFAGHWTRLEAEHGPVFDGHLQQFISEAGR